MLINFVKQQNESLLDGFVRKIDDVGEGGISGKFKKQRLSASSSTNLRTNQANLACSNT